MKRNGGFAGTTNERDKSKVFKSTLSSSETNHSTMNICQEIGCRLKYFGGLSKDLRRQATPKSIDEAFYKHNTWR